MSQIDAPDAPGERRPPFMVMATPVAEYYWILWGDEDLDVFRPDNQDLSDAADLWRVLARHQRRLR